MFLPNEFEFYKNDRVVSSYFFCCRAIGERERFFCYFTKKKPGELSRGNNKEIPFVGVGVFIFCLL